MTDFIHNGHRGEPATGWLRKIVYYQETVMTENGTSPAMPAQRATVAAVIENPWVNTPSDTDLQPVAQAIAPQLAKQLTDRLLRHLGGADNVEAFGKAAIIGTEGELEHGAALIHTPYYGNLVREFLAGESIICFADDRADAGEALIVPMWHKHAAATRTHYQTVPVRVPDAPRPDEIVVIAAASTGPRPHPRIGDRTTDPKIKAQDLESVYS